jgi:uncharacterized NAD-dependent epimerase/dehydratase family protein
VPSPYVLLIEGAPDPLAAKPAIGMLRYRRRDVAALLDPKHAGSTAEAVLGIGGDVPVVASLDDVRAGGVVIGTAPGGGRLDPALRRSVRDALARGLEVVNGLHELVGDDPELRALAARTGAPVRDLRRPPARLALSENRARHAPCFRIHTVGTDGCVGKMTVALELTAALAREGVDARFLATGQTGMLISGGGVAVDAIPADFVAGAIEAEVLARRDAEVLVIEGQGSLAHPQFSAVTLGLLHGCAPDALVLCGDATRTGYRGCDGTPPSLDALVELYVRMASLIHPARAIAVALRTAGLDDAGARRALADATARTGLPAADALRFGCAPLVAAARAARGR